MDDQLDSIMVKAVARTAAHRPHTDKQVMKLMRPAVIELCQEADIPISGISSMSRAEWGKLYDNILAAVAQSGLEDAHVVNDAIAARGGGG